jgi:glyoxylase-like metal-dependent hydrolase (beta-lactamase superfamily II)
MLRHTKLIFCGPGTAMGTRSSSSQAIQKTATTNIIDGGFADTGDQVIQHIEQYHTKKANIANVVLTHADNDHAML